MNNSIKTPSAIPRVFVLIPLWVRFEIPINRKPILRTYHVHEITPTETVATASIQTIRTLPFLLFLLSSCSLSPEQNLQTQLLRSGPSPDRLVMPFVALDNERKWVRNWNLSMEIYESRSFFQGEDRKVTINQVVDTVLWVDVSNAKIVTIQGQKQGFIGERAKVPIPELYRLYKMGNPAVRLADTTREKERKVALVANFNGIPFQLIMLKKPRAPLMMYEEFLTSISPDYWKITDSGGWCQARVNPKYRLCKTFQIDSIGGHGIENYRMCKDSNLVLNWKPTKDTVFVKAPPGYQAIHMTSVYPYMSFMFSLLVCREWMWHFKVPANLGAGVGKIPMPFGL